MQCVYEDLNADKLIHLYLETYKVSGVSTIKLLFKDIPLDLITNVILPTFNVFCLY